MARVDSQKRNTVSYLQVQVDQKIMCNAKTKKQKKQQSQLFHGQRHGQIYDNTGLRSQPLMAPPKTIELLYTRLWWRHYNSRTS